MSWRGVSLLILVFLAWLTIGCASKIEKSTLVLDYADFGPQAMAYRTLGPKNLPWQPDVPLLLGQGDVLVVVYRDVSLDEVKQRFSADQKEHIDYRYLTYDEAIEYLDQHISRNLLRKITAKLQQTRETIILQWR